MREIFMLIPIIVIAGITFLICRSEYKAQERRNIRSAMWDLYLYLMTLPADKLREQRQKGASYMDWLFSKDSYETEKIAGMVDPDVLPYEEWRKQGERRHRQDLKQCCEHYGWEDPDPSTGWGFGIGLLPG